MGRRFFSNLFVIAATVTGVLPVLAYVISGHHITDWKLT